MQSVIAEIKRSLMAVVSSGGFNERDSNFGRSLADQVRSKDSLSASQAYHALQMLHRGGYGQQIEKHGYRLPPVDSLPKPAPKINQPVIQAKFPIDRSATGVAKVIDKKIVLEIEKGEIGAILKAKVPEIVWKEKEKKWIVPLSSASYLANLGIKGIQLDPMIDKIIKKQKLLAEIGRATDWDFDVKLATGSLLGYQKAGVKYLDLTGRALLGDDMGLGKSQINSANILTPSGWKKMGDIRVGDKVFGSDGKPHNVTGVFPQGKKDIYKVTFSDGSSTMCCDEHLWAINTPVRKRRGNPNMVKPLKDFMHNLHDGAGNRKYFIPIVEPIEFDDKVLPVDPYLLGCLIGNGSLSGSGLRFTSADEFTIMEVARLVPDGVELKYVNRYDYSLSRSAGCNQRENPLGKMIRQLDLNHVANAKFIPDIYKFASVEQRVALLQGLLDTDGHVSSQCEKSPAIEYVTVSKRLADDVQFLVESLGGRCYIGEKESPKYMHRGEVRYGQDAYRLNISFGPGINPFRLPRKAELWKPRTKYLPTRAFEKVEYVGREEATCISVDANDHLYVTDHCILTHNTLQSIAYLQLHPEIRPAVIVCPSSLKLNWAKEIDKWMLPDKNKTYEIIEGRTVYPLSCSDIFIINYDILESWVDALLDIEPAIVIGDEAQKVKNADKKRSKAFRRLSEGCPGLILATGTPIMNRPAELWTMLNLVNPHAWGSYREYAIRYCDAKLKSNGKGGKRFDASGAMNLEELHERSKPYIIRRLKSEVLKDLPPKRRASVVIELSAKHKQLYKEAIGEVQKTMSESTGHAGRDYTNVLAKIEYAKQASAAGKLECGAIQWIEDFLESGEKLIVFATHTFVIDAILSKFGEVAVSITGSTKNADRQKAVELFQGDDRIRLFVGNIDAAGVGITLTKASNVCFLELGAWTPGAFDQAEDRAYRLGQLNSVTCYYMVGDGTIDQDIFELLERKRVIIGKVMDNNDGGLNFGIEQELMQRIKAMK